MKIIDLFKYQKKSKNEFQDLFLKIENLLNSARKLFTQSEEVKKVIALEKNAVEKSSSASHEIESMVATTASAAFELSNSALSSNKSVTEALNSLETLTQLISKVDVSSNRLQTSVAEGLKEISSVTITMQDIREKAKVINEIVFQTKLLSFNASVEAARAGEHGKGFAVVAEEMGKLARASGEAAKEIESILNTSVDRTNQQIQKVTKELESVAHETVKSISEVSLKSNEISSSFSILSKFSNHTELQSNEISKATKEQETGISLISQSLLDLESSTQHLDIMAIESYQNSAELAAQVELISFEFKKLASSFNFKITDNINNFDFDSAISAHIDWKMKLSKYLNNPDGSLEHEKVCKDNACMLGKWIYAEGSIYEKTNKKIYSDLKNSHAEFHKTAAKIIQLINNQKSLEAKTMLEPNGPYMKISDQTISLIKELKDSATTLKAS